MLSTLLSVCALTDTIEFGTQQSLDEIVVVSDNDEGKRMSVKGRVATIDEHLSEFRHVTLVRRGSYAMEPVVNNMQTERISTTIDGMKIFYACTDKMDPVTSYVESSNLQSILLNSGLSGNPQSTGSIGGSLDLKLRRARFGGKPFRLGADIGHEFNGHMQVYGIDAAVSSSRFYTNGGVTLRHAGNYEEGGGKEVLYSQFQKLNLFDNIGVKVTAEDIVEATIIYDRATNVGYPALNMDVSKAEALIMSLAHKHLWPESPLLSLETKVYHNRITHIMDDSKRPDVDIRMDMPGKSQTSGLYSLLKATASRHDLLLNFDLYVNRLFADMTMYPGGAAPMYMVTWPDVRTLNSGFAVVDDISLPNRQSLQISAKFAAQRQKLESKDGYKALSVFFPGIKNTFNQLTGRMSANYQLHLPTLTVSAGAGWGSRAPSVTEAYGYYLNNTFDQYDYIGNPRLKNESAIEVNASFQWQPLSGLCSIAADANAFFFSNYIIGQFEERLSPMTVNAEGVKVYCNQSSATISNVSMTVDRKFAHHFSATMRLAYGVGRDENGDPLPLISPVAYSAMISYTQDKLSINAEIQGNAKQSSYGKKYGETQTPAYTICRIGGKYEWSISSKHSITLRTGIDNLLDKRYTTYSDWCGIPQKGRNVYANISIEL